MGVKDVLLGKAMYKWFVDVRCDYNHDGPCDSENPACSFKNLACGVPYRECKPIAEEAAKNYGVPLINERGRK